MAAVLQLFLMAVTTASGFGSELHGPKQRKCWTLVTDSTLVCKCRRGSDWSEEKKKMVD